ncbi:MAG: hypothetical protein LBU64_08185 [Planctomycetota bacterium]|jgi:hypothetical protein|nr:hypothetical protein [Planctomycetota bacterium]
MDTPAITIPANQTAPASPGLTENREVPAGAETPALAEPPTPAEASRPIGAPTEADPEKQTPSIPEESIEGTLIPAPPLAGLESMDGRVFWLAAGEDITAGLAAVPKINRLILLVPEPEVGNQIWEAGKNMPDNLKVEIFPAGMNNIGIDAVEHLLYLVNEAPVSGLGLKEAEYPASGMETDRPPLLIAALPEAGGAVFFKGALLLLIRGLEVDEAFRILAPDLERAGTFGEEIRHRLSRLKDDLAR